MRSPATSQTPYLEREMSKVVSNVRPPSLRTDEDLVQLVLELHCRALTYGTKQQHDAASAAVTELKRRLGQRDVALKLADELENEESRNYGYESKHNGYTAAGRIR